MVGAARRSIPAGSVLRYPGYNSLANDSVRSIAKVPGARPRQHSQIGVFPSLRKMESTVARP